MKIWNLDPYINVDPLENLHFKICQGIAVSNRDLATRVVPHYEMQGNINLAIDFKNSNSILYIFHLTLHFIFIKYSIFSLIKNFKHKFQHPLLFT